MDWIDALVKATQQLMATVSLSSSSVDGLALSCAAHIGVLVDKDDQPVRPAILWNDQRTASQVDELEKAYGDQIFAITHQRVSTTWTLPHLLWIRQHDPQAWANTQRVLLSKDFVLWWLTGQRATDPATALSSQLFDATTGQWSALLCEVAGIRTDQLPKVLAVTDVAGRLREAAARRLGLRLGTPVVVGTLDSAAETFGAQVNRPGQCLLRLATAGGVHLVLTQPKPHDRLITYPHPLSPLWYCQAGTNSCASAVRWAINNFSWDSNVSFAQWDSLAASVCPGSEGLIFHPYLMGERCPHWNPNLRASFVGATMRHGKGHLARAVYEGTAFSIRDALSILEGFGIGADPFIAVGGGTTSQVWLQIVADVLSRPIQVAPHVDSSYGASLLGLIGLGLREPTATPMVPDPEQIHSFSPDKDRTRLYDKQFQTYQDIHQYLAPLYGPETNETRRQSTT